MPLLMQGVENHPTTAFSIRVVEEADHRGSGGERQKAARDHLAIVLEVPRH